MLLIALTVLAAVWAAVIAVVIGLCVSAARGDRQLPVRHEVPMRALRGRKRFSPLIHS